jgi:hypothetical protein
MLNSLSPVTGHTGQLMATTYEKMNQAKIKISKNRKRKFLFLNSLTIFSYLSIQNSIVALLFSLVESFYQSLSLSKQFFVCSDLLFISNRSTNEIRKNIYSLLKIESSCQLGANDFRKNSIVFHSN